MPSSTTCKNMKTKQKQTDSAARYFLRYVCGKAEQVINNLNAGEAQTYTRSTFLPFYVSLGLAQLIRVQRLCGGEGG